MSGLGQKQTHALQQSTPGLGEVLPNFRQQLTWAEGLRNVIITARGAAQRASFSVEVFAHPVVDRPENRGVRPCFGSRVEPKLLHTLASRA